MFLTSYSMCLCTREAEQCEWLFPSIPSCRPLVCCSWPGCWYIAKPLSMYRKGRRKNQTLQQLGWNLRWSNVRWIASVRQRGQWNVLESISQSSPPSCLRIPASSRYRSITQLPTQILGKTFGNSAQKLGNYHFKTLCLVPWWQNNKIEGITVEHISHLYQLETLNLQNNWLTTEGKHCKSTWACRTGQQITVVLYSS